MTDEIDDDNDIQTICKLRWRHEKLTQLFSKLDNKFSKYEKSRPLKLQRLDPCFKRKTEIFSNDQLQLFIYSHKSTEEASSAKWETLKDFLQICFNPTRVDHTLSTCPQINLLHYECYKTTGRWFHLTCVNIKTTSVSKSGATM